MKFIVLKFYDGEYAKDRAQDFKEKGLEEVTIKTGFERRKKYWLVNGVVKEA